MRTRTWWVALTTCAMVSGTGALAEPLPAPHAPAEVQINVCEPATRIAAALKLEPARSTPTEIWYFDTQALDLLTRGRVLRLRLAGKSSDLTLKVANQSCGAIQPPLPAGEGKCEYDLHGDHFTGALSVSRRLDAKLAEQLRDGKVAIADVLTATQLRFVREPGSDALPQNIALLGPVFVQSYRRSKPTFEVEAWTLPRGETFVEISQKARYADALKVRAGLERELAAARIAVCGDQGSRAGEKLRLLVR